MNCVCFLFVFFFPPPFAISTLKLPLFFVCVIMLRTFIKEKKTSIYWFHSTIGPFLFVSLMQLEQHARFVSNVRVITQKHHRSVLLVPFPQCNDDIIL